MMGPSSAAGRTSMRLVTRAGSLSIHPVVYVCMNVCVCMCVCACVCLHVCVGGWVDGWMGGHADVCVHAGASSGGWQGQAHLNSCLHRGTPAPWRTGSDNAGAHSWAACGLCT